MSINYVIGDATQPQGQGNKIIAHVCNDVGKFGAGFALAVAKRWPDAREEYLKYHRREIGFQGLFCGSIIWTDCYKNDGFYIANMIAQRGVRSTRNPNPIQYDALRICLQGVRNELRRLNASVHCPRIGAGLAGGDWTIIEQIIEEELCAKGVSVTVYDLPVESAA